MATTVAETRLELSPTIRSLLGSLRTWIRVYVCVEGLAAGATWLGVAFWASLAIDWLFEPPAWIRGVMMAVAVAVLIGVLVQLILRRVFARLSNSSMAMLLERRFSHLNDGLLTAVVLSGRGPGPAECNPQMLAQTCRQAAAQVGEVELRGVFSLLPLGRALVASCLLSVSMVAFGSVFPGAWDVWLRRNLLLAGDPWPRKAALTVEGFPEDPVTKWRTEKVARGGDLRIVAKADTRKELPSRVEVYYRVEGGRRDRKPMTRVSKADPAREPFQRYAYDFQGTHEPIRFDVIGDVRLGRDVRVPDLRIEVVDSPTVNTMTLDCKYPAYMGRSPRTLPATGVMQIPQGAEVTVHAQTNKDLVRVQVDCTVGEGATLRTELQPQGSADDARSFSYTLKSLDEDTTLLLTLSDTDGITGREPVRLTLAAVTDQPPQLTARLSGIATAITPQARLPAVGRITDDYGIARVWFEYAVDQQEPATHPVSVPSERPIDLSLENAALDLAARDQLLAPGQKLLLGVKAADLCDLGQGPNVGSSERWLLDVVTPDQLRVMLESRELVLRQRFEAIIQEVTETRDLLLRMDFAAPEAVEKTEPTPGDLPSVGHRNAPPNGRAADGSEPGDQPEERLSPQRQLALRTLGVQRALTNSGKNAHETQGVADGFDEIRLQLINNRIDTEELIRRLAEGIADPLHRVAQEMFPRLQTRLERLQESLEDEKLGPQRRDLARTEADAILLEMRKALDRMIELEDFNEAVEFLRAIIKLQEDLGGQIQERHKQRIRDLLED